MNEGQVYVLMLFTTFFLQLTGNKYHINCAASTSEPALRFRQDKINYVLENTGEHDFNEHFTCYREKRNATTVATFCSVTLLLVYKNNVGIFHCCGRHLADQQSRIKLCSLLCKAHPPYLMTSAGMLSGSAALLSLRLRMSFSTSSKDGGSSSFGMIGSVGRSSRKSGSELWTLFSRFCRYSAHLSRISSLFLIKTPPVLLTGCKEKRLRP